MLDENQWEFIITEKPPKPRCRHSAVAYKGHIIIFGGNDSEKSYNDVYVLRQCTANDYIEETQLKIAEPTLKNDMQNLLFNPMLADI